MSFSPTDPKIDENAKLIHRAVSAAIDELFLRLQNGESPVAPEYLSPRQASQLSGTPVRTLEAMRGKREGPPYYKVGGRIRYKLQDIRDYIEKEGPVV